MLPASLSLSPKVFVLLHLSEPARSQRENLREKKKTKQKNHSFTIYVYKKGGHVSASVPAMNQSSHLITPAEGPKTFP